MTNARDGEKTPARLFEIVELVASTRSGMRGNRIATVAGIPRSTVFRLLKFLTDREYLHVEGGIYTLGLGFARLGHLASEQNPLLKTAHPLLEKLSAETLETVHLARLCGDNVIYIDKVEGRRSVRMGSLIGSTSPVYCTGVGKAMIAFLPEEERGKILSSIVFRPFTDRTLRSAEELEKEMESIRSQGFACDDCEHEEGVCCYASPIFDFDGRPVAGISVSGAALYFRTRGPELAGLVLAYAKRISDSL